MIIPEPQLMITAGPMGMSPQYSQGYAPGYAPQMPYQGYSKQMHGCVLIKNIKENGGREGNYRN